MTRRAERRQFERAISYKLCSLALQYPDEELIAGRDEPQPRRRGSPPGR